LAPALLALSSRRLRHPIFICRKGCQQIDCPAMDAMDCPKTKSILSDRIFSARVHIVHVDSSGVSQNKVHIESILVLDYNMDRSLYSWKA